MAGYSTQGTRIVGPTGTDFVPVGMNMACFGSDGGLAIHDALKLLDVPVIEVHLSDPETREEFRHFSYIKPVAAKVIKGKGPAGYTEAITALSTLVKTG